MRMKAAVIAMSMMAPGVAGAACPSARVDDLGAVVGAMYGAISAGDAAKARTFMDPGFYIFEGGVRMDAAQILGLMDTVRARGLTYSWSPGAPDGRVSCTEGWIAYVNRGSITDAAGVKPASWLESAALHYDGVSWKILFMHSTRAPDPK